MRATNLPDWLIYIVALGLVMVAADSRARHADAPAPPPPVPGEEATPLSPLSPFNGAKLLRAPDGDGVVATAFSIGEGGLWLTAQSALAGCSKLGIVIAPGRAAEAKLTPLPGGRLALLTTQGGSAPLPLGGPAHLHEDSFLAGFPQGGPGEAAIQLLGPAVERQPRRGGSALPVEAWVQIGRTDGVKGLFPGMAGAPVLDGMGRVEGVLLGQATRRGRLYAAPLAAVRQALADAKAQAVLQPDSEPVTTDNYGRAADALRRDLRVAPVWCGA